MSLPYTNQVKLIDEVICVAINRKMFNSIKQFCQDIPENALASKAHESISQAETIIIVSPEESLLALKKKSKITSIYSHDKCCTNP